jgi:hypothetical protein
VQAVEPHRSFAEEPSQDWYGGDDWDGGRHGQARPAAGAPPPPGQRGAASYGDVAGYPADRFGESDPAVRFGEQEPARHGGLGPGVGPGGAIGPRSGEPIPPLGADLSDTGRRPMEPIDVAALRRQAPDPVPDFGAPTTYNPQVATDFAGSPGYGPAGTDFGQPDPDYTSAPARNYPQPTGPGATYGPAAAGGAVGGPTAEVGVYQARRAGGVGIAIAVAVAVLLLEIPALRVLFASAFSDTVVVSGTIAGTFLVAGLPAFGYGVYGLLSGGGRGATSLPSWLRSPLVYVPIGLILLLCAALATS